MNKFRKYFIGDILARTDDVFEQARAIMILRLSIMFSVIFMLPLITDFILGYQKAQVIHGLAFLTILFFPFAIKMQQNVDRSINLFFTISFLVSSASFMCLNPARLDRIGVCWAMFFLILGILLQRGKMRLLFCCCLNWVPMLYVIVNMQLKGALTWEWMVQKGTEDPPIFLIFIPITLLMYAAWNHSSTIEHARQTITLQKDVISEKNKDITASIRYAKRIQISLMPTEKYISRILNKKKENT
jgi:hypothetical protein